MTSYETGWRLDNTNKTWRGPNGVGPHTHDGSDIQSGLVNINRLGGTAFAPITLGYGVQPSNSAAFSAETDVPGCSVTVTVPAGRRLRIAGRVALSSSTVANDEYVLWLSEDGSHKQLDVHRNANIGDAMSFNVEWISSPNAGTHTYKLSCQRTSGTGNAVMNAAGDRPGFIVVEDITGSALSYGSGYVPVGLLGQAQVVADITGFGTSNTAISGLTVNVAVPAGRTLRVTFSGDAWWGASGASIAVWGIWEDGVRIAECEGSITATPGDMPIAPCIAIRSPSAGAHVYQAYCRIVAGTFNLGANNAPARLVVEDITATPAAASGAPSSTLGYAEIVTNTATTTSSVDFISVTVTVPAGRRIRIKGSALLVGSTNGDGARLNLMEAGVGIQLADHDIEGSKQERTDVERILTPSAGTHTYVLNYARWTGTGTVQVLADTHYPAYLLVEDITGALWPSGTAVTAGMLPPMPACRAYRSTNQTIASLTDTALTFDANAYDNGSLHSTSSNTSRITIAVAGLYHFQFWAQWATNNAGSRWCYFRPNGSGSFGYCSFPFRANGGHGMNIGADYYMNVGDYVEVVVGQDTGGNLDIQGSSPTTPSFSATKLLNLG